MLRALQVIHRPLLGLLLPHPPPHPPHPPPHHLRLPHRLHPFLQVPIEYGWVSLQLMRIPLLTQLPTQSIPIDTSDTPFLHLIRHRVPQLDFVLDALPCFEWFEEDFDEVG